MLAEGGQGKLSLKKLNNQITDNSRFCFSLKKMNQQKASLQSLARTIPFIEKTKNFKITPHNIGRIGILIDLKDAPGLQVRPSVFIALIEFLKFRGFDPSNLFLCTFSKNDFQNFTPSNHHSIQAIAKVSSSFGPYFNKEWFYDSSMPPGRHDRAKFFIKYRNNLGVRTVEERKSMLPACLFEDDVFWISLGVARYSSILGIDGATTGATLFASTNTERFLSDTTLGPVAATEMLAIPEFWQKHLFSLIDLDQFQIASWPGFNAEYRFGEDTVILGTNPVAVDYFALKSILSKRKEMGFRILYRRL